MTEDGFGSIDFAQNDGSGPPSGLRLCLPLEFLL